MREDPKEERRRVAAFQKDPYEEDFLLQFNKFINKFEAHSENKESPYPIIYLVGVPRSGTTLLSQVISRHLSVGYINNVVAKFWLNPVFGIRLSRSILGRDAATRISFDSVHGTTRDPWGPHEYGYFWRWWLRLDESPSHQISQSLEEKIDTVGLREVLGAMLYEFNLPIVFKNLCCGLNARFLSSVRPNSIFILIERDDESVVHSILRCRKERYGDEKIWWSLKPKTFEEIKTISNPVDQVTRQIFDCKSELSRELDASGSQIIRVNYVDLCADPKNILLRIRDEFAASGLSIDLVDAKKIPTKLSLTN